MSRMANTPVEATDPQCSEWLLIQPMVNSRKMTTWKPGLKFQPEDGVEATQGLGPLSRLRKKGIQANKGNFKKKNRMVDAPNLLSVVSATPELKERAKAEAKARQIKIEEYRKFKNSRTIVKKQPLQQPKSQWQNMIAKSNHAKKSKSKSSSAFAGNKKKSKSTGDIAIADWKAAYQDILSPNSGSRKFVARRDLITAEKVASPKKKVRGKARSACAEIFSRALPQIDSNDDAKSEEASVVSRSSTKKAPLAIDLTLDDEKLEARPVSLSTSNRRTNDAARKLPILVSPISERDEHSPENLSSSFLLSKQDEKPYISLEKEKEQKEEIKDEYADFEDFDDASETMDVDDGMDQKSHAGYDNIANTTMDLSSSIHNGKPPPASYTVNSPQVEDAVEAKKAAPQKTKSKTLILEFSMPALTGEPQRGNDDEVGLEVPVDVYSYGDMSSVGSWPSIESEDSYETRMNKMMQRWMDIDGGDVDEYFDNDVHLDDNVLDHIVLAAPDLEKAMEQFHEMTGIMPTHVGPLQGLGAKTAHVGLDNNRYIEILAPDSEDPGPLGDELKALEDNTLTPYHYAIRSSEVSRLIEGYVYDVLGWDPDHIAMVQALPDDTVRQWDLLTMYGHDVGGVAPYYVRWVDPTHHPTAKIPLNATLLSCRVVAPEDHDVHKLITGVGGIDIETGDPTLECTIETPKGNVIFSAKTPKGLVFPGYDDEYQ